MAGSVARSALPILLYVLAVAAAATAQTCAEDAVVLSDEDYWARRNEEARSFARAAYISNPIAHIKKFNREVVRATTRRSLAKYKGPCKATNNIDRCWRCRSDWATDRKRLAQCARGFGHKTVGGVNGDFYVVTDASDDHDLTAPKMGTLRFGVIQDRPLWITFAHDMIITLQQELIVNHNKTIDGRGAQVYITGAMITLQSVTNVIIHNVHIHHCITHGGGMIRDSEHHFGQRTKSDGDGISILSSSNIWIDHVSMWNCTDGLIDVINASTAITISNGHFTKHNHVMLFGASNEDKQDVITQITVAFNHFGKGLVQRMPRCRYGFFHVVNNDYTHWIMYAIGGNMNPTIISQGNRFIAPDNPHAKYVTKREYTEYKDYKDWVWKSKDDELLNGALFNESGGQNERKYDELDFMQGKHGRYVGQLTEFAGTLKCIPGKPC